MDYALSLSYSLMLQAKWDSIQQKFEFARAAHMEVTTKFFFLFVVLFNGFAIYVFMGIHGEKQQQQKIEGNSCRLTVVCIDKLLYMCSNNQKKKTWYIRKVK